MSERELERERARERQREFDAVFSVSLCESLFVSELHQEVFELHDKMLSSLVLNRKSVLFCAIIGLFVWEGLNIYL